MNGVGFVALVTTIIDSVAPDLISGGPQSLALHEALADLTALHMALRSEKLREAVLEATDYELTGSTPFNAIAEEMGAGRGQTGSLRDMAHLVKQSNKQ